MRFLRSNTAARVTVGPFLDVTDGFTPELSLVATSEHLTLIGDVANFPILLLDALATATGTGTNDLAHITDDNAGFYDLELTQLQLNFLGRAMLSINNLAAHRPVYHEFMVIPPQVYDSFVLGTDFMPSEKSMLSLRALVENPGQTTMHVDRGETTANAYLDYVAVIIDASSTTVPKSRSSRRVVSSQASDLGGEVELVINAAPDFTVAIGDIVELYMGAFDSLSLEIDADGLAAMGEAVSEDPTMVANMAKLMLGGHISAQSTVTAAPSPTTFTLAPGDPAISVVLNAYVGQLAVPGTGAFKGQPMQITAYTTGRQVTVTPGWSGNLAIGDVVSIIGKA